MGGAPGGMPGAGGAPATPMGGSAGKLLTTKRGKTTMPKEEEAKPGGVRLTSLERVMDEILTKISSRLRMPQGWAYRQYPLGPYRADYASPYLKLVFECDGEIFHSGEKKVKDAARDKELAKFGWTTARFTEKELEENKEAVERTVADLIVRMWKKKADKMEKRTAGISGEDVLVGNILEAEQDTE